MIADLDIKEEPNWDWFILLVAKTGMRFSEALAITPKDFDFGRQTLSISKTWDYKGKGGFLPTKNKSSVRKIQIDWQIVVKFSELVKGLPEDEPIFVGEERFIIQPSMMLSPDTVRPVGYRRFPFTDLDIRMRRCFCLPVFL